MAFADRYQVQRAAAKTGVDPKLFCDKGAEIFKVRLQSETALKPNHSHLEGTCAEGRDHQ